MDFFILTILEAKVSTKQYQTANTLEIAICKISSGHIRAACKAFPDRLDAIIRAKGGYIEQ